MDPKQTLLAAERAVVAGDFGQARGILAHYQEWRARGGFEPDMGEAPGDAFADLLVSAMSHTHETCPHCSA